MKKKEIMTILENEIQWHQENKGKAVSKAHFEGFVQGLNHALSLIKFIKWGK